MTRVEQLKSAHTGDPPHSENFLRIKALVANTVEITSVCPHNG